jgi:capsular polysaccharide biosynthesis protein
MATGHDAMRGNVYSNADISIWEVLGSVWRLKWTTVLVATALSIAAGSVALILPKQYQATVTVSPVAEESGGGRLGALGSVLSEVGGLSSSLSSLTGSGGTQKAEYTAVLQSEAVTENYIRSKGLLQVLYADLWDARTGKWKVDDVRKQPTLWKANQYFKKRIRIVLTDTRTGLVTFSIKWKDPIAAATWANDLVRLTNDYLRSKAITESERNIAYLTEQAAKTDIVGVRQAVYAILQSEINKVMLARGRDEYALRVIDPAVPPEIAVSPSPILWAIVGMLTGLLACVGLAFLKLVRERSR